MKIFSIGLSRTGTQSLYVALTKLKFKIFPWPFEETFEEISMGNYNLGILQEYDGITDLVSALFYAQYDKIYPHSKFILTVRDRESWLESCKNHWKKHNIAHHSQESLRFFVLAVFGCHEFSYERFSFVYDQHYNTVLRYFQDRPDDLLVMDITKGEGWEKLCPFLDKQVLSESFPRVRSYHEEYR